MAKNGGGSTKRFAPFAIEDATNSMSSAENMIDDCDKTDCNKESDDYGEFISKNDERAARWNPNFSCRQKPSNDGNLLGASIPIGDPEHSRNALIASLQNQISAMEPGYERDLAAQQAYTGNSASRGSSSTSVHVPQHGSLFEGAIKV